MKTQHITLALLLSAAAMPIAAHSESHDAHQAAPASGAATALSSGEVRKVDPDAKKITIRHGPLENLGMPSMTMVFQVGDPELLNQVKAGDKIRFKAEKAGGAYIVTRIEPQ